MADRKADQIDLEELSGAFAWLSDKNILEMAKAGDLDPLFNYIHATMSPPIAELIVGLLGRIHRPPAHRLPSSKTVKRQLDIVYFIRDRLDEGMSPSKAKGEAAREFSVSKFTVRDACKKWLGPISGQLRD
jgi:hypothetical protein